MKIKKIKENFEDMQLLLEDAYNSGFISEKKFNRYTETFMEAAAKLDNMKQLKEENKKLKKQVDKLSQKLEDREDQKEQEYDENEYDEEDEYDRD